MKLEYTILKNNVIKCCRCKRHDNCDGMDISFIVNYEKLNRMVEDIGLKAINCNLSSKQIGTDDVALLSEYLKDKRLSWLNNFKEFTVITFIEIDAIDDDCKALLNKMNTTNREDPDLDKVATMAKILATYPCYNCLVVSYKSNDPIYMDSISYLTGVRANKVSITKQNYTYNHQDMS